MRTAAAAVLLTLALGLDPSAGAAQSIATFKSSVDLVPISAIVHDRHGRLVTTLSAADFEILDKGQPRRIVDFQLDRTSPLAVALLVDVSGSMRLGPKLAYARAVAERILGELQDGRDEVAVFTFDAKLRVQQPFTVHPATIDPAIDRSEPFGTTSLYDAIASTARQVERRPAPRRAIVVFTDGVDTSSSMTAADVSAVASAIDVPVYIVVTVPPIDQPQFVDRDGRGTNAPAADLRDLAAWTGGDLLWTTTTETAAASAHQIVAELRHQYLIAIESAAEAEWRPLDVRVRGRNMTVRARSGYFSRDNPH